MSENLRNIQANFRLRIKFSILGRLVYLSHKETVQALERVIRRANLPFDISCGFSPHMKLSFCSALPTGVGAQAEFVDVFLTSYVDENLALQNLQACALDQLPIIDCFYVDIKDLALDEKFVLSTWQLVLQNCNVKDFLKAENELYKVGFINIERKNKKPKQVDLHKHIVKRLYILNEKNNDVLTFITQSFADGSLRPDIYIKEIISLMGSHLDYYDCVKALDRVSLDALPD
ncbi:MAG: TIGR03936 family radical SAM-associated protein [Coriobacteriales bacterium]|nr:TIGR03936 family radical SAM-associated protein [Coriobacteriales bacterium]